MPTPQAYLLTWTCYGTWLHGDERGSVDANHRQFWTPYLTPDRPRAIRSVHRQRCTATILNTAARAVVQETIIAHCRQRGWELHALNVRSNHVHVVMYCGEQVTPESALGQLKAWATRRLREAGLAAPHQKIWTEHGSTRYLWDQASVAAAIAYVTDEQGGDLQ